MRRVLPIVGFTVLVFGAICWRGDAFAQDVPLTNADQLAAVVDESGLWYPLASPVEPSPSDQRLGIFWADFSQLTNAIGGVRNFDGETQYGITIWRLRLTRITNEVTLSYPAADTNLWQAPATDGDDFSNHYDNVLRGWCILQAAMNYESYDDLIADGYTNLTPQRIVVDIMMGDVNDCDTYEANADGGTTSFGAFTTMDEDPDGLGGDPCSITNLSQTFYCTAIQQLTNHWTVVSWQSCPVFLYEIFSANQLTANTLWQPQAYIWGQPTTTVWTDTTTTVSSSVTQRFYKIKRIVGSSIAAGPGHSLTLTATGILWAWGHDDTGELGDGITASESLPVQVAESDACTGQIVNAQAVSAGGVSVYETHDVIYGFSVAADTNGMVWAWGDDPGDPSGYSPVAYQITGISNVFSVAGGAQHVLALRANETVWAWGDDTYGELGVGGLASGFTNLPIASLVVTQVVAIAAGDSHSVALDANGGVWTWAPAATVSWATGERPTLLRRRY